MNTTAECQLCGMLVENRTPIHVRGEHPSSTRWVCDRCTRHDDGTRHQRRQDGLTIKETPAGNYFRFRLVKRDHYTRPDIWRKAGDSEWMMLIAAASPADVQRFF